MGDVVVGGVLEVEEGERGAECCVDLLEQLGDAFAVEMGPVIGGEAGQFMFGVVEVDFGEAMGAAAGLEEFAVEGGEEPAFGLGRLAELAAFAEPDVASLLHEVAGVRFGVSQAEGKAVESTVVLVDEGGEIGIGAQRLVIL